MSGHGHVELAKDKDMETGRRINWLIAIALVGWLFYLLAPVLTPFVAAALLAYVGDPLADRLQRLKLPRTLAVATVFLITFILLALLVLLVGPLIGAQVGALFDALPEIAHNVEQVWLPTIMGWLNIDAGPDVGFGPFLAKYGEMFGSWSGKALMSVSKSGGVLAAAVLSLFLIPILTFYLLRDWDMIIAHIGALIPESQRDTVVELARESDEVLGAFLRGQVLVMLGLAVIYSLGLSIVGVEYAIAIGVVAGLVSFVPYLGFVFGMALAGLTVALEPNPLWSMIGVVATFSIGQLISLFLRLQQAVSYSDFLAFFWRCRRRLSCPWSCASHSIDTLRNILRSRCRSNSNDPACSSFAARRPRGLRELSRSWQ
jgi:predicted PurR-regulated permease PerM